MREGTSQWFEFRNPVSWFQPGSPGRCFKLVDGHMLVSTYLLKTELFNFLGNMGNMSVKDKLPQGLEFYGVSFTEQPRQRTKAVPPQQSGSTGGLPLFRLIDFPLGPTCKARLLATGIRFLLLLSSMSKSWFPARTSVMCQIYRKFPKDTLPIENSSANGG